LICWGQFKSCGPAAKLSEEKDGGKTARRVEGSSTDIYAISSLVMQVFVCTDEGKNSTKWH